MTPERVVPVFDMADTTLDENTFGEDPAKELDPQLRDADVDAFEGK